MKKMRPSEAPEEYSSDDEISVGCPSPQQPTSAEKDDDVMRDTKLMIASQRGSGAGEEEDAKQNGNSAGVRSFSILDILNHRPSGKEKSEKIRRRSESQEAPVPEDSPTKIMRPWDYPHLALPAHLQAAAAAAAGFLHPNRCLPFHPAAASPFLAAPPFGLPPAGLGFHPSFHHPHGRLAGSSFGLFANSSGHLSPSSSSASPDYTSAGGSSDCEADDVCSTSGHSATSAGSPLQQQQQQQQQRQKSLLNSGAPVQRKSVAASSAGSKKSDSPKSAGPANPSGTPLDALFQMTSKTFDGSSTNGADSSGKSPVHPFFFDQAL